MQASRKRLRSGFVLFLAVMLASCSTVYQQNGASSSASSISENSSSTGAASPSSLSYKPSILGSEIPATWNQVFLGDVGPMPLTQNTWLDPKYIVYSFASRTVAFGDMNWSQVDVYQVEGSVLSALVAQWKKDPAFNQAVAQWGTEMIDGQKIDVVTFKTEPDESVDKGAAGGKMYFIPPQQTSSAGNGYPYGLILSKQAKGDANFETGVAHFLQKIKLSELSRITFTPGQ